MQVPKDLFEELIDRISDGFVALDKNWNYTFVNEKGASFLNGHTSEQLIGKHIWTVFPEGIGQPFQKNYEKVMNERVSITMIDYYEPWDKYFENRINPTKDGGISILFTDVSDLKRAEKVIRDSENNMRLILDNTEEFFVIVDKHYKVITSNRSVKSFATEVLKGSFMEGSSVFNIMPEGEKFQMKALFDDVLKGNSRQIKFKRKIPNGTLMVLHVSFSPIINEFGRCEQFIVNTRDVTKEELALKEIIITSEGRKKAEELAIEALNEKQKIMDSSLDVICSFDFKGKFLQVSIACKAIWGYEPEELIGKKYIDLVFSEDKEVTIQGARNVVSGQETSNFENRCIKKDGSLVPIVWSAKWDTNEKVMYCIARDASEKKNAEMALLNSEQKYRLIFNLSPLPKWIYDLSSLKILEVNEAAMRHYGFSKTEFLSKTINEIISEEESVFEKLFNKIVSDGPINFGRGKHLKANNEIIHVETCGHRINYNGLDSMMIINNDITEKIKSEEIITRTQKEILASNERYQYVIKATSDAIWDWDMKSQKLYWADSFETLFGHKLENNIGDLSAWYNNVHTDEREMVVADLDNFVKKGDLVWQQEYRFLKENGSYAHVADRGIIIKDQLGEPYRMIGSMRDITKEKVQLIEIKRIQQNLDSLINNTNDYIWSIDKEMKIIACNNAFKEVIYFLTGKIVEEGTYILIPELEKEILEIWSIYYTRALNGEVFEIEEQETLPDMSKRYGAITFTPIVDKEGNIGGVACFGKNITELKKSEERLLELNKELEKQAEELAASNIELERFAYIASHDLQEPLRMVSSFLQLLEKKYEGNLDETAQKYIHFAVDGAARMKVLIKDLLQYSKIGTGRLELVSIDMNEVLSDIQSLFKEEINNLNGEIIIRDLPIINAGKTAMMQLFQNLVGNALKYRSPDTSPKVEICFTEDNHHWKFKVQDNGLGIDAVYNDKIFVIFQRLHNKDEFSGTGIGLAICKKIVERYQGQIWVESELGAGSTFIFTIAKNPII